MEDKKIVISIEKICKAMGIDEKALVSDEVKKDVQKKKNIRVSDN